MRSSKDAGDGLDTPSERQRPVPHVKPWPGTHKERESEAARETPSAAASRLQKRMNYIWEHLERVAQDRDAYAPAITKDDDNDVIWLNTDRSRCLRIERCHTGSASASRVGYTGVAPYPPPPTYIMFAWVRARARARACVCVCACVCLCVCVSVCLCESESE